MIPFIHKNSQNFFQIINSLLLSNKNIDFKAYLQYFSISRFVKMYLIKSLVYSNTSESYGYILFEIRVEPYKNLKMNG